MNPKSHTLHRTTPPSKKYYYRRPKSTSKASMIRRELVQSTHNRSPELRPQSIYKVEYTDTFNGEANYSWVRRAEFTAPTNAPNLNLVRRAKQLMGLEGLRGKTEFLGYGLRYQPSNSCTVLFILWE